MLSLLMFDIVLKIITTLNIRSDALIFGLMSGKQWIDYTKVLRAVKEGIQSLTNLEEVMMNLGKLRSLKDPLP